jgi:hypothetical protein
MRLPKLTIEYPDTDETTVVTVTPRTEVLWERRFGDPYMSMWVGMQVKMDMIGGAPDPSDTEAVMVHEMALVEAMQELSPDHLYYLGYAAATKCQGIEYEDWLDTIANVSLGAAAEDDAAPLDLASSGSLEPAG